MFMHDHRRSLFTNPLNVPNIAAQNVRSAETARKSLQKFALPGLLLAIIRKPKVNGLLVWPAPEDEDITR